MTRLSLHVRAGKRTGLTLFSFSIGRTEHSLILAEGGDALAGRVEQRTVTLIVSPQKLTANVMKNAVSKYLAHQKEKHHESRLPVL
jgi:hypothetical protein